MLALAPSVVSQNNQFRLPTVTERIEFSLKLLESSQLYGHLLDCNEKDRSCIGCLIILKEKYMI